MIKRMVFLFRTQENKENLLQYERVIRALLRKFRKTPLFSYTQIDTSLSCRDRMRDLILNETSRRGAIFMESDAQSTSACMDLLESVFDFYGVSHHVSSRAICYAEHTEEFKNGECMISCTETYKKENIAKATAVSVEIAKKQRHALAICLDPLNTVDKAFLHEVEIALNTKAHITADFISVNEMISLCLKTIPTFDVILTKKEYASLIAMHLNSMPEIPSGYIVSHSDTHKVYRRQILQNEETGNLHHFSSLLSLAAVFEVEFEMKSAAAWLRKAASLAFLKESSASSADFISAVIKEIEMPIRKRRTE